MKKSGLLLILIIGVNLSPYAQWDKEIFLTKSLSGMQIKEVSVQTSGGVIQVEGTEAVNSRVEVFLRTNKDVTERELTNEEMQKVLNEYYTFSISTENNTVKITAKPKDGTSDKNRTVLASFKVFVPENVSSTLSTKGGPIYLSNLNGTHTFSTSGGHIVLQKITGRMYGKTSGGSIKAIDCHNEIDLSTSGGGIEIENSNGSIHVSTSGGAIHLQNVSGKINIETAGGTIQGTNINGSIFATTSHGNINLKEITGNLETSSASGQIFVDIKEAKKNIRIINASGSVILQMPSGSGLDLQFKGGTVKADDMSSFRYIPCREVRRKNEWWRSTRICKCRERYGENES